MIGLWMLYAVVVALLLGGAAAAGERVLRLNGRSARWVWAAALGGTWLVPVLTWLRRSGGPTPSPMAEGGAGAVDPAALAILLQRASELPRAGGSMLAAADGILAWTWGGSAVAALLVFGLAVRRVLARSRSWPEARVQGEPVRLSGDFGPAVVGIRRPVIVLPRWILSLEATAVRLVLRHEEEHRAARDTLLLTGGLVLVLLAPWNPALWWLFRRLRMAVELDCDRRVLARGVSPRSYGDLLLRVGGRLTPTAVPAAALAEPPSFLERRLKMMTKTDGAGRIWKSLAGAALAGLLVTVACETPAPTTVDEPAPAGVEAIYEATGTPVDAVDDGPLILVDGEELEGERLEGLDPEGIERIEVVKGGAAREIWGERGKHGVVKIFTKGAEALEGDETLEIVEVTPSVTTLEGARNGIKVRGTFSIQEKPEEPEDPSGSSASHIREVSPTEDEALVGRIIRATPVAARDAERGSLTATEDPPEGAASGGRYRVRGPNTLVATAVSQEKPEGSAGEAATVVRALPVPGAGDVPSFVIVDGDEYDGKISDLDLDRIDRVEVLKGEAALDRYGEKARDGAIVITLKGGGA